MVDYEKGVMLNINSVHMEGDTRGDAECRGAFTVLVPLVQEKDQTYMGKEKQAIYLYRERDVDVRAGANGYRISLRRGVCIMARDGPRI